MMEAIVELPQAELEKLQPIFRLEALLLKQPQVDLPIEHTFIDGLYARTMHIPAGTTLTGAIHRHECLFVVRRGEIVVTTDNGPVKLVAGDQVTGKAGSKRAGYAITDVTVTTYHANPTNETDAMKLLELFTIPAPLVPLETIKVVI